MAKTLSINISGNTIQHDNSSGNATGITLPIPANTISGEMFIESGESRSNILYVRQNTNISGEVVLPSGSSVSMSSISVSSALLEDSIPDSDGRFTVSKDTSSPITVTAITEDGSGDRHILFQSICLPSDDRIVLSAMNTAISVIWNNLGIEDAVGRSQFHNIRNILKNLEEVGSLSIVFENKLSQPPYRIDYTDTKVIAAINQALSASIVAVRSYINNLESEIILRPSSDNWGTAIIDPPGYEDNIRLEEQGSGGNLSILNNSLLYVSLRLKEYCTDRTLLYHMQKGTGSFGMAEPRSSILFGKECKTDYPEPQGMSCKAQVVTGGDIGTAPSSMASDEYSAWLRVRLRTMGQGYLWRTLKPILATGGNASSLLLELVNVSSAFHELFINVGKGDADKAEILDFLKEDARALGPITKLLGAKQYGSSLSLKQLKDMGLKLINRINLVKDISEAALNDLVLQDLENTRSIIEYDVRYKFIYLPDNPKEMETNGSVRLKVKGGTPPYTWTVNNDTDGDETFFSLDTKERCEDFNILYATGYGCKDGTVVVRDAAGDTVTGCIRSKNEDPTWSITNPDSIALNTSINVRVRGGSSPYTWSINVKGKGFVLDSDIGPKAVLSATNSACGHAEITVTDSCDRKVTGTVRSPRGRWVLKSNNCELCGEGGQPTKNSYYKNYCCSQYHPGRMLYHNWEKIVGGRKQVENIRHSGCKTWVN
ncbi:MAG: hypothetical protein MI749_01525, partial [Desulfovibrionales bacterium]|nr:hypothetical protein [Desulfovibrionales bacterium]